MPIRWSALKVSEAADRIEKEVEKLREPLENIRAIVKEAKGIPNLPEYMRQPFAQMAFEAERILGGIHMWNQEPYLGVFNRLVDNIRKSLPDGAVEAERAIQKYGSQSALE